MCQMLEIVSSNLFTRTEWEHAYHSIHVVAAGKDAAVPLPLPPPPPHKAAEEGGEERRKSGQGIRFDASVEGGEAGHKDETASLGGSSVEGSVQSIEAGKEEEGGGEGSQGLARTGELEGTVRREERAGREGVGREEGQEGQPREKPTFMNTWFLDWETRMGGTALILAAVEGCVTGVRTLALRKVRLDYENRLGHTAVTWACVCGHDEVRCMNVFWGECRVKFA